MTTEETSGDDRGNTSRRARKSGTKNWQKSKDQVGIGGRGASKNKHNKVERREHGNGTMNLSSAKTAMAGRSVSKS